MTYCHCSEDELATKVIGCAIEVHKVLGPGLLENAYKKVLAKKLMKEGFQIEVEKILPLEMEDIRIEVAYKIDILVENKLVLELKSVEYLNDLHLAQVINYLNLGNYKLGLLINFNVTLLKFGLQRVINDRFRKPNY
ncbi:GxxExxY protein [Algoriphagus sp. AK58]|uniref:GxxExxY protein n=1 Tax=Algoriphagus sp. AK58 TaxID=1406877 RepID=UPI00164F9931|nr:GxxExxY protein [Algoriphagus sp. AK58]MBC6369109.1 GxxExxY protein [Algoriphagus sp. AK58]